jgi:hypothetical protein
MSVDTDTNVELLAQDPDEVGRRIAGQLQILSRSATGEELVYSPLGRHSYYRDFLAQQTGRVSSPGAQERLSRHGAQMERLSAVREERAWQRGAAAGMEYRVTPDRTPGHGGYFAPPAWLNQLFATANRPGRVLAGLMPTFPLPVGVSSVNVPVISTGTAVEPQGSSTAVLDQDIADAAAKSSVAPFAGQADVGLQLLEQSPQGAHLDWAIFQDLSEAYDSDLESQLLAGPATGPGLTGVTSVTGIVSVAYTDASPTGKNMWTPLSQVPAQIGDARLRAPECFLMRTARWFWIQGQEDSTGLPFGLSPIFIGKDDDKTPDPIGGIMSLPVFLDDAIPVVGGQDSIICLRPRDLILLEGQPQTLIAREPLSGSLGVRLQMHCNAAAITGRRPGGIGVLTGTGMTVQTGY